MACLMYDVYWLPDGCCKVGDVGEMLQMGEDEDNDDDEWEPVEPITSPCGSISGYWGLSIKKLV